MSEQILLNIITITKDDPAGVASTICSTRKFRACSAVRHIIIDGSGEPEQQKVKALLPGEQGIEYYWQASSGIAQAFNLGIGSANAEWLWFLNGRDEVHPQLDELFLLRILEVSRADALMCEIESLQSGVRHTHPPLWDLWPPLFWVPHPATLIRRRLFERFGLFDPRYAIAMDGDLWVRFFSNDVQVDMLSLPLSLFDQNGISSIDTGRVMREADAIVMRNFWILFRLWFTKGRYFITSVRRFCASRLYSGKGYGS